MRMVIYTVLINSWRRTQWRLDWNIDDLRQQTVLRAARGIGWLSGGCMA